MVFDGRIYSVLIVSASEKITATITALLPENTYGPIRKVTSISAARRSLLEKNFDFVVINAPVGEDMGLRLAMDVSSNRNTVCLLLVRSELLEDVDAKVVNCGVFTLAKPTSGQMISQAFRWMVTSRERLRSLEQKNASVEEKMNEIRLINRAKWVLIDKMNMTEPDAHRYIEKQAMDCCATRAEIAGNIIRLYE